MKAVVEPWLTVWAVAGLFSLAGALTIAELGASFPSSGGLTIYLREAFGPFWGFLYGWALFVVIQTASIAAVARGEVEPGMVGFDGPAEGASISAIDGAPATVGAHRRRGL